VPTGGGGGGTGGAGGGAGGDGPRGAGGGGGGRGGPGGPPPAPLGPNSLPLDYALAPALASDEYLVWAIPANAKLYCKAIAPLATKFDQSAIKMKDFLESLFEKAMDINWNSTLIMTQNGMQYNLVQHYRMLSMIVI
jgi:hypothetical protein